MAFVCPACGHPKALRIVHSITLPPDSRSDDIIVQTLQCEFCRFRGAAIYEESRRGGFDSESWDHRGYHLNEEGLARLDKIINRCPDKQDKRCRCESHQELSSKDVGGRWIPPKGFA